MQFVRGKHDRRTAAVSAADALEPGASSPRSARTARAGASPNSASSAPRTPSARGAIEDAASMEEALIAGAARRFADEPRGKGRPRSLAAHTAILIATLEILVEVSYEGLTIEAVAQRAGVGKATVYRRWESKAELVVEMLETVASATPPPDTGNTREDMVLFMHNLVLGIGQSSYGEILRGLAAELSHNETVAVIFRDRFLRPRRQIAREVIERGIERGDVRGDIDVDLTLDLLAAPFYYRRMVSGEAITFEFAEAIIDHVMAGIATRGDPAIR